MLEPNDTIATIWNRLTDPRLYAARVYQKARPCEEQHGNADIRIGITGSGQKPCYRISYETDAGTAHIWGSFWDMGDPLDNQEAENQNWSKQSMSIAEVRRLLESIRPKR